MLEKCECKACGAKYSIKGYTCDKIIHVCSEKNKSPDLSSRMINFGKAIVNHVSEGMPKCTQEQINSRLEVCKGCELFNKTSEDTGFCSHSSCGCNISKEQKFLNKLAWADQKCPIDKWGPIEKSS